MVWLVVLREVFLVFVIRRKSEAFREDAEKRPEHQKCKLRSYIWAAEQRTERNMIQKAAF